MWPSSNASLHVTRVCSPPPPPPLSRCYGKGLLICNSKQARNSCHSVWSPSSDTEFNHRTGSDIDCLSIHSDAADWGERESCRAAAVAVKAVVVVVVVQCRRRRECQARRLKEDWHSLDINFHIPAASLSPSSLAAPLVPEAAER